MDQGTETKVAKQEPEEENWDVFYQMVKDRLLKDKITLDVIIGQMGEDEPFYGVCTWIRGYIREDMRIWQQIDRDKRAFQKRTEGFNAFLDKFQKWMDRYGPMLESERQQWEKIQ